MKLHANARTCPKSRQLLVDRVQCERWSVMEAAEAAGITDRTARRWLARWWLICPRGSETWSDGRQAWRRPWKRSSFRCDYGIPITIGARTFINYGCIMLDPAPIAIGSDCQIATRVQLITATHPIDPGPRRDGWEYAQPISIGDNVWLGAGVIVCPGVTIGDDTVVGAGSVVTRDLPAGVVAFGVPAKASRDISDRDRVEVPDD